MSQFLGYAINVVLAAHIPQPAGIPATPPLQQKNGAGTLKNISWVLDSCTVGDTYSSLSFFFHRESSLSPMYDFRNALVDVSMGGTQIFGGMVASVRVTKDRVSLRAMGIGDILDRLPLFGARRMLERDTTSGASQYHHDCLSFLNENGSLDNDADDGLHEDYIDAGTTVFDEVTAMDYWLSLADVTGGIIDAAQIRGEIAAMSSGTPYPASTNIQQGLASEIQRVLRANGKIGRFYANADAAGALDGQIEVLDSFAAGSKKTVVCGGGLANPEKILYDYSGNFDLTAPLLTIGLSGRCFVDTMLHIKLDAANYSSVVKSENDDTTDTRLRYRTTVSPTTGATNGNTDTEVFDSKAAPTDYEIGDIMLSNKSVRIAAVYPRMVDPTKGEFLPDFEVFLKARSGIMKSGYAGKTWFLLRSKEWEQAKRDAAKPWAFVIAEGLQYSVSRDRLQVEISGFSGWTNSGGALLQLPEFRDDSFSEMIIPVTLEIENRTCIGIEYDPTAEADPFVATVIPRDADDPVLDTEIISGVVVGDHIRPIRRVSGLAYYETTGGTFSVADSHTPKDTELSDWAIGELLNRVEDDGSALEITIPVQLWQDLPAGYPTKIGDWVTGLTAGTGFGGLALPRRMMVREIDYRQNEVVLGLR